MSTSTYAKVFHGQQVYRGTKAFTVRVHRDVPYVTFKRNTRILWQDQWGFFFITAYGLKVPFRE